MTIRFKCPGCKVTLKVGEEKAGLAVACPQCKAKVRIPAPVPVASRPAGGPGPACLPPPGEGVVGREGLPNPSRKPPKEILPAEPRDTPPVPAVDRVGSYVFGSLLLAFFVGVFCFCPETLPEFKQRMLAVSCSLLAGIFAAFMSGGIGIKASGISSPFGKVALRASGGTAVFALVMVWWLSPLSPVKPQLELNDIQFSAMVNQISVMDKGVEAIFYSFDGQTWKPVERFTVDGTGFKGVDHASGRVNGIELAAHDRVFVKYRKAGGGDSKAREFPYERERADSVGKPVDLSKNEGPGKAMKEVGEAMKKRDEAMKMVNDAFNPALST